MNAVLDVGSYTIKGIGVDQQTPQRTLVGYAQDGEIFTGNVVVGLNDLLNVVQPVEKGRINDWDAMECIYKQYLNDLLRTDPTQTDAVTNKSLIMVDRPFNGIKSDNVRSLDLIYNVCGDDLDKVMFVNSALLSLYSVSRTSGIAIEVGHSCTTIVPVHENAVMSEACKTLPIGGQHLSKLIQNSHLNSSIGTEECFNILRSMCHFKLDFVAPSPGYMLSYELPDGQTLFLGEECFLVPEVLFRPNILTSRERLLLGIYKDEALDGIVEMVSKVAERYKCASDDASPVCVLYGGTSLIENTHTRLLLDLDESLPGIRLRTEPERDMLPSIGGCIISEFLQNESSYWVTRKDFEEYGPHILYRRGVL
ncbi:hypothetical protein AKO1_015863 [Acrasis kona]|uniref:Actin n=1 Tax=Acrasis kona TaxID=1008807 RepID=A0AAW2ZH14_9EUKA